MVAVRLSLRMQLLSADELVWQKVAHTTAKVAHTTVKVAHTTAKVVHTAVK